MLIPILDFLHKSFWKGRPGSKGDMNPYKFRICMEF